MKPVGILGGMGPDATILLMRRVLAAVPDARDDADHIPLIVHQNPQVPSRIKALIEGGGADPGPVLAAMARDLERAGAAALAMPCNTAHAYAGAVRGATTLPFLDMVALTARDLSAHGARRVGMLASPATRRAGVFDAPFAAAGLEAVHARDDGAGLLAIIRAVKAGQGRADLGPALEHEARAMQRDGADHLLVACTEISLLEGSLPTGIGITDSLDCLTGAIVTAARA